MQRFLSLVFCCMALALFAAGPAPRNIVFIYADDLGYGDVSCYGATRVQTPNLDQLAREGLRFTDAHAAAATCTPSRYAMLTGQYAWRKKGTGVLPGNAALIIEPGCTTLASVLKKAGYTTGIVGKWHLGLGEAGMDWNQEIKPGPLELGFDYCFLLPATGDRTPCVYVENHRVVGLDANDPIQISYGKPLTNVPTGKANPELLKMHPSHGHDQSIINGISRIGYMAGGNAARWADEDVADVITRKAVGFMEHNRSKPFFLYFSTHDIHVPRVPHPRFAGKTGLGPRGDVIVQFDWCVGEIVKTLDRLKLRRNTMIIVSSDNGPVVDDGYKDDAVAKLGDHRPAGPLRGGKYSIFEGGTRVPFIVNWPGKVKPGISSAMICQVDFVASFAVLTGQKLGAEDAPDSFNVLPALLGKSPSGRDYLVEQAGVLSLRQGPWKFIEPGKGARQFKETSTETGQDPQPQLYHLTGDVGETQNVSATNTVKAKELQQRLKEIRAGNQTRFEK
jgi:arylsulfatase A-like enzyme